MKMKKLIPALAMLLVSAILLGTSTYAWFSMNTTVTATGMQIKAISNSTFLLIGEEALADADAIQAQIGADLTTEDLTVLDADAAVFPSKAYGVANASRDPSIAGATAVTTKALAAVPGNWYTANSSDSTVWGSTSGGTINVAQLTAGNFDDYVIKKTVKFTLADGSVNANNLKVTPTITMKDTYAKTTDIALDGTKTYYTFDGVDTYTAVGSPDVANIGTYYEKANDISAVKVLIVTDNNEVVVLNSSSGQTNLYGSTNLDLTSTTVHTADIYIYYDGAEDAVYSNNAVNLSGATIDLQFDVAVH